MPLLCASEQDTLIQMRMAADHGIGPESAFTQAASIAALIGSFCPGNQRGKWWMARITAGRCFGAAP